MWLRHCPPSSSYLGDILNGGGNIHQESFDVLPSFPPTIKTPYFLPFSETGPLANSSTDNPIFISSSSRENENNVDKVSYLKDDSNFSYVSEWNFDLLASSEP